MAIALTLVLLASAVLFDRLPELLITEERWDQADYVLVLGGGDCLAEAARRYLDGRAKHVLVVGRVRDPIVRLKIIPSFEETARRRLSDAGVPSQAIEVIPAEARTTWDQARALGPWLTTHPQAAIDVVCERLSSRRDRFVLRAALGPSRAGRLRVFGLSDSAIVEAGWWHHRYALKSVASACLAFAYDYFHGQPSERASPRASMACAEARQ
ncbi:MAG TPA: hypothetical protein VIK18_27480 [Pirellulales bacterium]